MAALLGRRGAAPAAPATARRERRDVFVSYAREDAAFVQRLHARLLESQKTAYVDFRDIPRWSEDWQLELYAQIEAADTIVVVLSPDSVGSPNVAREVEHAVEQRKRLRPLLIEDVDEGDVAPELARPQWIDFRDDARFDERITELLAVLATDVEWVQRHTRFLLAANDWERRNEDRSLLLGRSDLRDAERWLTEQVDKEPPATALQTRFIVASREAAERRRRIAVLTGLGVLALAVGLTVFALIQRGQAIEQRDQARSRELAARALATLPTDPEAGLRLALDSAAIARTDQTEDALQRAVAESHVRLALDTPRDGSPILGAAVSPDGRFAITGHEDGIARVWDLADGHRTAELAGSEAAVSAVAVSPDGRRAVTASGRDDGTARLWDTATGEQVAALELDAEGVGDVLFSPDGSRILTTTSPDSFTPSTVWGAERGKRLARIGGAGDVVAAAWDGDGRRIATVEAGGVEVWDARSGARLAAFPGHINDFADSIAFSPDGRHVAVGGSGRSWITEVATGERVFLRGHVNFEDVTSVAFCPDGSCVLTASNDDTARTWALDGTPRAVFSGHTADVTDATFSADGRYVVTASNDSTARVWATATGGELAVLRGHAGAVTAAAFVPGGTRVLTAGQDGTARVWEPGVTVLPMRRGPVDGARFSADGAEVVTVAPDGRARVWRADGTYERSVRELVGAPLSDAEPSADGRRLLTTGQAIQLWNADGRLVRTLEDGTGDSLSAVFSPDAKLVATDVASGVAVLDAGTGRHVARLEVGKQTAMGHLVFSPDSRRVAAAGLLTGAHVWDARTGARPLTLAADPGEVDVVVFSPDGRTLATAAQDSSQVRLWDLAGRRAATLERGGARDVVFSPDGRLVATVADREVRIRDARSLARVATLRHENLVAAAAFDRTGRLVLTASEDATPRLWDARSGRLIRAVTGHRERVTSARFSPDGSTILSSSEDGTAQIHACDECVPYEPLVERARSRVTPLTGR